MARSLSEGEITVHDSEEGVRRRNALRGLLTVRISSLSELLRRSSTLANRRAFGLSWIEWRVMSQAGDQELSLGDLSDLLNLDAGQVSRAVKGLAERGLLSRTRRPGGPSVVIAPTEAGKHVHAGMVDQATARTEFLLADIPSEEVAQLARLLDVLRDRAQLLLDRERAIGGTPSD